MPFRRAFIYRVVIDGVMSDPLAHQLAERHTPGDRDLSQLVNRRATIQEADVWLVDHRHATRFALFDLDQSNHWHHGASRTIRSPRIASAQLRLLRALDQ